MGRRYQDIRKRLSARYEKGEADAIGLILLEELESLSTADVLMGKDDEMADFDAAKVETAMERLLEGEPIQYVVGKTQFCGLTIRVKPGVLIPRPETEELVEAVSKGHPASILDIGTGSGCIALALKHRFPQADVTAMDVSADALRIAQENAQQLEMDVRFVQQDIFHATPEPRKYDLIISNPPYVCECERAQMECHVLDYEPEQALFVPDNDPLLFYRTIIHYAQTALMDEGVLAFETNREYARGVGELMKEAGWSEVEVKKDMFNNERIVIGCL
ncbi:MAG: peptide chain release factor N(5)-glutamine methyltransferase [Bacteroidaceae bacterium]|nr:peptide chain release factor N(5)-glutamine methyltransferase [Bacteroidaceae bacterium]